METASKPLAEADLQAGQRVVYPNQGVCLVSGIETKEIGGIKAEFLALRREEDGASVLVPRTKLASIGIRRLAESHEIKTILDLFTSESGDPEKDWKVRHRTHADKMNDGSLISTAEVLKALHSLAERRPLPQKERELYDAARHLVVNEVAVALSVSRGAAEDTIDFCLTPPAGSPRAQLKLKLKAERQAAEDSALLDDMEGMTDGADAGADVDEAGETAEADEPAEAEAPKPAPKLAAKARAKAKPEPSVKAAKAKPATKPAGKAKAAAKPAAKAKAAAPASKGKK